MAVRRWAARVTGVVCAASLLVAASCDEDTSRFDDDDDGGTYVGSTGSNVGGAGVGGGTGGSGVGGQGGVAAYAAGVQIDHVEFNQGVGIALAEAGMLLSPASYPAPLVAGRPGLLRVFWKLDPDFEPRSVEAQLELSYPGGESQLLKQTRSLDGEPSWDTLDGSFAFELAAADVRAGMQWRVVLREVGDTPGITPPTEAPALPADAATDLGIADQPMHINVIVIPASLSCTPNAPWQMTTEDQNNIRGQIYNLYPVATVDVQFRAPQVFQVSNCNDSPSVLDAISQLRNSENLGPSYYYHAILPQADQDYMPNGGYAWILENANMGSDRVSYSVNFWPQEPNNVTHELGHNHGREHSFNDSNYIPNGAGQANCGRRATWGYGIGMWQHPQDERHSFPPLNNVEGWLIPPTDQLGLNGNECQSHPESAKGPAMNDMMSYADPYWIGTYTYAALAQRVAAVSQWGQMDWQAAPEWQRQSLHGTFLADGSTRWRLQRGHASTPAHRRLDSTHAARLGANSPPLPIRYKRSSHGSIDGVVIDLPVDFAVPQLAPFEVEIAGMIRSGVWADVQRTP